MPRRSLLSFLNSLAPPPDHVSDAILIRRYLHERDHAAFELLVRRHADAVWSACRGILRNDADAEDAFQATFLSLSRQANRIHAEPTIVGWLYRVAVHAAIKRKQTRIGLIERRTMPASDGDADAAERSELQSIVHQELARMKESDRLPLVLCDLEGRTREQAASILGWPLGTVNGRLSRARDRLKSQLIKRGITAPTIAVASLSASAALSTRATAVALNLTDVSLPISTLSTGALIAMSTTQFKFSSALAAGIMLVIGAGTIIAVGQDPTNKTNRTGKDEPKATVKKREAIKLKDGRFTLFPELFNTDPKKQLQELAAQLNKIGFQDEEKLNGGTDRIRIEQLHHTVKSLLYNIMILESDAWDVTFLNQFHIDVDQFYKTANQIPFSKQELIPFAKIQLVARIAVENLVIERVNVAGSLRKQQLHETIAKRYQSELDLVELENAQRK